MPWRTRSPVSYGGLFRRHSAVSSPDHLNYGLVATGNRASAFNDNFGIGGVAPTYAPERVTNFEIGSKNRVSPGGLPANLNIAGFVEAYHIQMLSSLLSIASAAKFASATGQRISFPSNFGRRYHRQLRPRCCRFEDCRSAALRQHHYPADAGKPGLQRAVAARGDARIMLAGRPTASVVYSRRGDSAKEGKQV